MSQLVRFGIAMESSLLDAFDGRLAARGFANRSEAIRDLVRADLVAAAWEQGEDVAATISLVYDHHTRELTERLNSIQHEHAARIASTLHVHLDHHHCLEVIVARGPARELARLSERLLGTRGVLAGGTTIAGTPPHAHHPGDAHDGAHSHDAAHAHPAPARRAKPNPRAPTGGAARGGSRRRRGDGE